MSLLDIVSNQATVGDTGDFVCERWLGYVRVSTEEQARVGVSIEAQKTEITDYADKNHAELLRIYEDTHSAFNEGSKRPGFVSMLKHLQEDRSITGIVVHDSSRFSRDSTEAGQYLKLLQDHGVRFHSVSDPPFDQDTPFGILMRSFIFSTNEASSRQTAMHTLKGMRQNVIQRDHEIGYCYKNGGMPPWGFVAFRVVRGIDKRQQDILKTLWGRNEEIVADRPVWEWSRYMLIDLRLKQKASYDTIATFLNDHGIPSPKKVYWGASSIKALLRPAALLQYAGYAVWNVHDKHGHERPTSQWVIEANAHPAIISAEEAEQIQAINDELSTMYNNYSSTRQAAVRSQGSRFLLSGGLFTCSRCGGSMTSFSNRNRDYYVCIAKRHRKGLGCGNMLQLPKEEVEEAILQEVSLQFNLLANPARLAKLVNQQWAARNGAQAREYNRIEKELARIKERQKAILEVITRGIAIVDFINEEIQSLQEQEKTLRDQLRECEKSAPKKPMMTVRDIEEWKRSFMDVMAYGSSKQRREFVRLFVDGVQFDPASMELRMELRMLPPELEGIADHQKKNTPSLSTRGVNPNGSGGRRLGGREHVFSTLTAYDTAFTLKMTD